VLTWTEVTGAKYYKIFDGEKIIDTVEDTSCTVSGLTGNTSYKFYVQAFVNESVSSEKRVKSNSVKTKITPVDVKSIKVINRTADSVVLSWSRNIKSENYSITVNSAPGSTPKVTVSTTNPVYVTITGITAETTKISIVTKAGTETSASVTYEIPAFVSTPSAA
ncbi:MAG: hypothetical protein PUG83_07335, partial [Clostridiaceae bacterium]|nr:hypothetical protein [Clostridiaceae bacterium]